MGESRGAWGVSGATISLRPTNEMYDFETLREVPGPPLGHRFGFGVIRRSGGLKNGQHTKPRLVYSPGFKLSNCLWGEGSQIEKR